MLNFNRHNLMEEDHGMLGGSSSRSSNQQVKENNEWDNAVKALTFEQCVEALIESSKRYNKSEIYKIESSHFAQELIRRYRSK